MGSHEDASQFEIRAVLQVKKDGHDHIVKPGIVVQGSNQKPIVDKMPGADNVTVSIASLNAENKLVELSFVGLNKTAEPKKTADMVVLEVSHKPFMGILWIGTILLTLGTILAMSRRLQELKLVPATVVKKASTLVCKKCKTENDPEAKFCINCGQKLPAAKK